MQTCFLLFYVMCAILFSGCTKSPLQEANEVIAKHQEKQQEVALKQKADVASKNSNASNHISILSYNIFLPSSGDYYQDERIKLFKDHYLQKFDIIILQGFSTAWTTRRDNFFEEASHFSSVGSPSPMALLDLSKFSDAGLAILSKYALNDTKFMPYAMSYGMEKLALKGVLYALVYPNGYENKGMHIFNIETQANTDGDLSENIRFEQVVELVGLVKRRAVGRKSLATFPILIGGTFWVNAKTKKKGEHSKEYTHLIKLLSQLGTVTDLFFRKNKHHPATFSFDKELNSDDDSIKPFANSSIDYLFLVTPPGYTNQSVILQNSALQKCTTLKTKELSITHLSNHFGISANISYSHVPLDHAVDQNEMQRDVMDEAAVTVVKSGMMVEIPKVVHTRKIKS